MSRTQTPPSVWHGQFMHFLSVILLVALLWLAWSSLGRTYGMAFWGAVSFPIVHQVFVWLAWRLELRSELVSKAIGFQGYLIIFFALYGGRFISLFVLAVLDQGGLGLDSVLRILLTSILLLFGGYAMHSVVKYFGMARAAGADHFDPCYRSLPLVKQGIFRYTSNGMYLCAFLLFWAVAIGFDSTLALCVAAFGHLYIWVHFFCTEKPDMVFIYGTSFD